MNRPDKRGEVVSLMGALACLAGAIVLGLLALTAESASVWGAAFLMAGGVGIWLVTLIQVHQLRLVAEERLEVAELERGRRELLGGAKTIFDEEELDQMEKLSMGRRLRSIEKFLVPSIALLTTAYFLVAGSGMIPWHELNMPSALKFLRQFTFIDSISKLTILNPTPVLFFAGGIAFVCFMMSRYALGMAHLREWSLLRAGGNLMFGVSAACLAVAISMLCVISGLPRLESWLATTLGILMIVLAIETITNFVLDFYRPRTPGQLQRPFYDSRLLGMFSEPEGILRSVAKSLDYQFGFKVSETWFYRLLGRIILPLLLVQIVLIFALTCITVVPPGHKAVIEHFGANPRVFDAGVHLTWCWPIDQATIIPVEYVQRMEIGFERQAREMQFEGAILWTKKHYKKEYLLLVPDTGQSMRSTGAVVADRTSTAGGNAPPINLLSMNMPVQWRVGSSDDDVIRFHTQAADVPELLEALAYRELTLYAAKSDLLHLLGRGGIESASHLAANLQASCDRAGYDGKGLGITIVHVGIGGVHPPADDDVAKSYEDVVSAMETRSATIKMAEGDAAQSRLRAAGDDWETLYNAIVAEDAARTANAADTSAKTTEVERLLRTVVGGEARARAVTAEKNTMRRVFDVKSSAEQYTLMMDAYLQAPEIYEMRMYLKILSEQLGKIRKFVIVLEDSSKVLYDMDLRPPQMLDVLGAEAQATDVQMRNP
ncbi:MAG: hypothetical protein HZA51_11760 [Planctomycetes bacterium]|nr:hypothetical protein [Planctomycetota bacterium]